MRKRFKTMKEPPIASSRYYEAKKKLRYELLKEAHAHFKELTISGEISIDVPVIKKNTITPKFKTIRIWGKEMKVTIGEYNTYCKDLGF